MPPTADRSDLEDLLWVNPDCSLKTRDYPETTAALKDMVEAARQLRAATLVSA